MRSAPQPLVPRTSRSPATTLLGAWATAAVLLVLPSAASAATLSAPGGTSEARIGGIPVARTVLPARTATAQRVGTTGAGDWLIGVGGDRGRAAAIARRHGGTFNPAIGVARIPRARADRAAKAFGPTVEWAGPDVTAIRSSSFDQPGVPPSPWARDVANAPSLAPLPGTLAPIGLVDDMVDVSVPELQGTRVIHDVDLLKTAQAHGTMVASTAAAPFDGVGVVGVAPGAPVLSWGTTLSCGDVSDGIISLVRQGAKVVNVSLGFDQNCFALWKATSYAYANGVTVVSASGNEGYGRNQPQYPASYPHVITVGAVKRSLAVAQFSNYNDYVDLVAPGVRVPVDIPLRFDRADGRRDGLSIVSGTSFASPYVAGGLSWILGARPALDPSQTAAVLRAGAGDLARRGWDQRTGFGLLNVSAAMAAIPPEPDALEPNDDPSFTRSSRRGVFGKPTIWPGSGRDVRISATGDSADDPVDAYRIKIRPKARVKIRVRASEGLTDLYAFDQSVRDFAGRPLHASVKPGRATDAITLRNTGKTSRVAFVVVNTVDDGVRSLSRYALTVGRG